VDGLVRNPLSLSFSEFKALPQVTRTRDFYCVEGWGVNGVGWGGVMVSEIMKQADIDPQATHLVFHSSDGVYTDSVTLEEARRDDTLLAHELDGALLPARLGQPLRLVLPGTMGYKYVKWVVRVEAINSPDGYKGYWEQRGYPEDATIA
jgi:DMSO/TMAO reductase YedYZ molybdopterin-dependent catalytic subunit